MINLIFDPAFPNVLEINGSLINRTQLADVKVTGDTFTIIKSDGYLYSKDTPWEDFSNNGVQFTSRQELKDFFKTFLGS